MAWINKVTIYKTNTTYDISPSPNGALDQNGYVSYDVEQANASSYETVQRITVTDTNSTIFTKLTKMMKNVRYLYNIIGNEDISSIGATVTAAINNISLLGENKADATHSHTVSDLPVSNVQVNSTSYIPTSALIYSMNEELNERIDELNAKAGLPNSFTTNISCGALQSGSTVNMNTSPGELLKRILRGGPDSTVYESVKIATWNSSSDVDTFFNTYNSANNWNGLKLGNYITINDGTYNIDWEIAGFDLEHNITAADGTTIDNGVGLFLIPKKVLAINNEPVIHSWYEEPDYPPEDDPPAFPGYIGSDIHTYLNSQVYNNLHTLLGNHIISRNVLLSNTSTYAWTTAYLTLMSVGQFTNSFGTHSSIYDDGEANYYIPLFWHEEYNPVDDSDFSVWTRNTSDSNDAYIIDNISGSIYSSSTENTQCLRPLMCLR